jgi:hypothetical protein
MFRKNLALAAALALLLGASAPLAAMPRDGGRGLDPIQRVVKLIKHLLHSITHDDADPLQPHP